MLISTASASFGIKVIPASNGVRTLVFSFVSYQYPSLQKHAVTAEIQGPSQELEPVGPRLPGAPPQRVCGISTQPAAKIRLLHLISGSFLFISHSVR